MPRTLPLSALLVAAALVAAPAAAELYVWVDENGHTHVSDDPTAVPEAVREGEAPPRDVLWNDGQQGPPVGGPGEATGEEARIRRQLRGAVDDLRRGETARATAALEGVLELQPGRPEAHWYLALLDRQRGRFTSAEDHLRTFLAHAGDDLADWRASAQRRLRQLEDERRLVDEQAVRGPLRLIGLRSPNFRIRYDAELGGRDEWVRRVTRYLEEARSHVGRRLGVWPQEPVSVLFYGKASYVRAWRHRFSFRTVGFFDGRIHVVSAAHPGGELRSLLHHEYTHALFREKTGSDRPLWLNEGLAEISERLSRGQPLLARGERFALRERIGAGRWIPLHRLAVGFGGLDDEDARVAYLASVAAVAWVEAHTDRDGRARLLTHLARGQGIDAALTAVVGVDQAGLEAALRADILAEFPETSPASDPWPASSVDEKRP